MFQSINDDPIETCVKCHGRVRKLFGTAGIIFKGSGFYVNDYRKGGTEENRASDNANGISEKKSSCPAAGTCPSPDCGGGASE